MQAIFESVFSLVASYAPQLGAGLLLTLQLLAVTTIFGFLLAIPLGLALDSRHLAARSVATVYSTLFRGSPMFVQLFLIYYGLPVVLLQIYGSPVALRASFWWPLVSSPFLLAAIAFILNLAAYMAEDLRGGLQATPPGERQAAIACGMSPFVIVTRILLPSALRRAAPALFNQVIIALKATALVSTIAMRDLMGAGSLAFNQTYNFTVYLVLAVIYLALVALLSRAFGLIERHFAIPTRGGAAA